MRAAMTSRRIYAYCEREREVGRGKGGIWSEQKERAEWGRNNYESARVHTLADAVPSVAGGCGARQLVSQPEGAPVNTFRQQLLSSMTVLDFLITGKPDV